MRPQRERCGRECGSRGAGRRGANVVVCVRAPCVSGSLVGVAVSAVVSAISVPGCVGERETRVKHIYLVASRPDVARMVVRTCQRKMACVARRLR